MTGRIHCRSNSESRYLCPVVSPVRLIIWSSMFEVSIPGGKSLEITAQRFLITAHFLACLAAATCSLDRLSSATCDFVRSSSRKILLGSENNFRLAQRAQSRSVVLRNLRKRVESWPSQAHSKFTSGIARVSLRNLVPTSKGSEEGGGGGRPLTLRFSSLARLVRSSKSLAWTTSSTAARGGVLSFPRATCAHKLI